MIKVFVHTEDREEIEIVARDLAEIDELFECFYKQAYYYGCGLMIDMRKVEYIEYINEDSEDE